VATTIALPGDHPSRDGLVAGVLFDKGRARVDELSPNAAAYFENIGARVRTQAAKNTDTGG
jgi:hypothetical protein